MERTRLWEEKCGGNGPSLTISEGTSTVELVCCRWEVAAAALSEHLRALFSYAALYIKPAPTLLQLTREPSALSVGSACKEAATGMVFKPLLELHRIPEP